MCCGSYAHKGDSFNTVNFTSVPSPVSWSDSHFAWYRDDENTSLYIERGQTSFVRICLLRPERKRDLVSHTSFCPSGRTPTVFLALTTQCFWFWFCEFWTICPTISRLSLQLALRKHTLAPPITAESFGLLLSCHWILSFHLSSGPVEARPLTFTLSLKDNTQLEAWDGLQKQTHALQSPRWITSQGSLSLEEEMKRL